VDLGKPQNKVKYENIIYNINCVQFLKTFLCNISVDIDKHGKMLDILKMFAKLKTFKPTYKSILIKHY
jgi:hypothetical protein